MKRSAVAIKEFGFTITELLIVVVVIAILATISVVAYTGIKTRVNNTVVESDLQSNLERISVFHAMNGRLPRSGDLATASGVIDFKVKISKRSVYAFYGYCTGEHSGESEIIMTAGTKDKHQFYISSQTGTVTDVSDDFDSASAFAGEYKCFDYLKPGSSRGEFRNMMHRNGSVEAGYMTVAAP